MNYRFPRWKDASWNSFDRQKVRYEVIAPFLGLDWIGAELGVYKGGFGEFLLGHCRKLYLVDLWYRNGGFWDAKTRTDSRVEAVISILSVYRHEIEEGRVEVVVERADQFLATVPEGYFDFLYLDTGHKYDSTRSELAAALRATRRGGYVFGDDYDPDPASGQHGVFRAVNQTIQEIGAEMVVNSSRQWGLRVP